MRQLILASNVRLKIADKEDSIEAIRLVVSKSLKETSYAKIEVDEAALTTVISNFVNSDVRERILVLLYIDDNIVGFLAGSSQPLVFNPSKIIASETLWWIDADYRNSRYGIKMFDVFEEWASAIGASIVAASHFPNEVGSKISKLYERRGYSVTENAYMKEIA